MQPHVNQCNQLYPILENVLAWKPPGYRKSWYWRDNLLRECCPRPKKNTPRCVKSADSPLRRRVFAETQCYISQCWGCVPWHVRSVTSAWCGQHTHTNTYKKKNTTYEDVFCFIYINMKATFTLKVERRGCSLNFFAAKIHRLDHCGKSDYTF